jgi:hypothetical protein
MSDRPGPSTARQWLLDRTARGPTVLRERVLEHAAAVSESGSLPEHLALAAERVLAIVAETAPAALGAFAESLLAAERGI